MLAGAVIHEHFQQEPDVGILIFHGRFILEPATVRSDYTPWEVSDGEKTLSMFCPQ